MADEIDKASEYEQRFLEININNARVPVGKAYHAKGRCNYCDQAFSITDKRLFCDGECATEQAKEDEAEKRKRGVKRW